MRSDSVRVEADMRADCRRQNAISVGSERGAVLIQVAVVMIVLIAMLSFVADYGLMWVSRRQAQNSADAGALAGAVALAYDDFADRSATGPAKLAAFNFAIRNDVAGEDPDVDIDTDVYFYPDDPSKFPDECIDDTCIRVDVYRNQARNNPLPIWFGQLVGLVDQGVRATAIARAAFGDATDCLKPWAVVDRWDEHWEDGMQVSFPPNSWNVDSNFDKYDKDGNPDPLITTPDYYEAATVDYDPESGAPLWGTYDAGTGFHPFTFDPSGTISGYTSDYGAPMSLKQGDAGDWNFGAGWFLRLDLCPLIDRVAHPEAPSNSGADCYKWIIKHCIGTTVKIGESIAWDNATGSATGPTRQAVETDGLGDQTGPSLINQDPGAFWNPALNGGRGGVDGSAFPTSPRIVAIPLVNPDALMQSFKNGSTTVPIGNIAGFFIEGVTGSGVNQTVNGRLMTMPGMKAEGPPTSAPSPFMIQITLIR
jgi:putative Flp pilus-assembly TadE/G-like protein